MCGTETHSAVHISRTFPCLCRWCMNESPWPIARDHSSSPGIRNMQDVEELHTNLLMQMTEHWVIRQTTARTKERKDFECRQMNPIIMTLLLYSSSVLLLAHHPNMTCRFLLLWTCTVCHIPAFIHIITTPWVREAFLHHLFTHPNLNIILPLKYLGLAFTCAIIFCLFISSHRDIFHSWNFRSTETRFLTFGLNAVHLRGRHANNCKILI